MSVDIANLDVFQGDDYSATVVVYHPDGVTPADITGYAPSAQIRRGPADSTPVIEAVMTAVLADAAHGQISLSLPHTETATLIGQYTWDLQLTETATGIILTILRGAVKVRQEVTRP